MVAALGLSKSSKLYLHKHSVHHFSIIMTAHTERRKYPMLISVQYMPKDKRQKYFIISIIRMISIFYEKILTVIAQKVQSLNYSRDFPVSELPSPVAESDHNKKVQGPKS
jgi:hypothetical protein